MNPMETTDRSASSNLAVLIPAYNEAGTVGDVVREYRECFPDALILVVDNNSSDETAIVARKALAEAGGHVHFLSEARQGKGMALRAALRDVDADAYVVVDADYTYAATDAKGLVERVASGAADMAVGDRRSGGSYDRQNERRFHGLGNALVTGLVNRLYRSRLRDVMSGLRAFNRTVAESVPLLHSGFEVETEITVHCLDRRLRIEEIPIAYRARPQGSRSKLRTVPDGLRILRLLFLLFKDYRPLTFFGGFGISSMALGILAGVPPILDYIRFRYVYRVPLAILAVGFVIVGVVAVTTGLVLDTVVGMDRRRFERRFRRSRSGGPGA